MTTIVNLTVLILALEIFLAECDRGLNNLVDFVAGQFSCSLASFDGGSSCRNLLSENKRLRSKVQIREAMFDAWG